MPPPPLLLLLLLPLPPLLPLLPPLLLLLHGELCRDSFVFRPGQCDITAHVDVHALAAVASSIASTAASPPPSAERQGPARVHVSPLCTQREFLLGMGSSKRCAHTHTRTQTEFFTFAILFLFFQRSLIRALVLSSC